MEVLSGVRILSVREVLAGRSPDLGRVAEGADAFCIFWRGLCFLLKYDFFRRMIF